MKKIKILLVDDHAIVRKGLISLLEDEENIEVVGDVSGGKEGLTFLETQEVDLVMLDLNMPEMSGMETAKHIKKKHSKTKILVFSMHSDADYILNSIENGVDGYLLKDSDREEILNAIDIVYHGEKYFPPAVSAILVQALQSKTKKPSGGQTSQTSVLDMLSKKETQILKMIADGKSSQEIAEELDLSIRTVSNHRANMLKKTNLSNTAELVRITSREGL